MNKRDQQGPKEDPSAAETQRRMNGGTMPLEKSAKRALDLQRRNSARRR